MSNAVEPSWTLRLARADEGARLARLAEATFRETFGADNKGSDMDLYCRETYGLAQQTAELVEPSRRTWVAETPAGLWVGFAQVRWDRAVQGEEAHVGELQRLYVERDWQGRGVAAQLMEACLKTLREEGLAWGRLGGWERNPRAIAFYRKWGFEERGSHPFRLGQDPQRDLLFWRPVSRG